jgi:hypothetical protein
MVLQQGLIITLIIGKIVFVIGCVIGHFFFFSLSTLSFDGGAPAAVGLVIIEVLVFSLTFSVDGVKPVVSNRLFNFWRSNPTDASSALVVKPLLSL